MSNDPSSAFKAAVNALQESHLPEALDQVQALLHQAPDWSAQSEVDDIRRSYQSLLDCMKQGFADSERAKFFSQFLQRTYRTAVEVDRELQLRTVKTDYNDFRLRMRKEGTTLLSVLKEMDLLNQQLLFSSLTAGLNDGAEGERLHLRPEDKKREELNDCLFHLIHTSGLLTDEEAEALLANFDNEESGFSHQQRQLFAGALTLALFHYFDPLKLKLLCHLYAEADDATACRALTGMAFALTLYEDLMSIFPELDSLLEGLRHLPSFRSDLVELQGQMMMLTKTEDVSKTIIETILPNMKEATKNYMDRLSMDKLEELMNDESEADLFSKSDFNQQIEDGIQQMCKFQAEGADIYYGTFSALKHYAFFHDEAHWFKPFNAKLCLSDSMAEADTTALLNLFRQVDLCPSDTYSMAFTLSGFQAMGHRLVIDNIKSMMPDLELRINNERPMPVERKKMLRHYLQDLYRFFHLYRLRRELPLNPFSELTLFLPSRFLLSVLMQDTDSYFSIAYLAYRNKNMAMALEWLQAIPEKHFSVEAYKMLGSTHHHLKHFAEAAEAYEKAYLTETANAQLLRRLAACHLQLGHHERALKFYRELLALRPLDEEAIIRCGHLLLELKQFGKAFELYLNSETVLPDSLPIKRGVMTCAFHLHKPDTTEKYFHEFFNEAATPADLRLAGHAAWAGGKLTRTIELYTQSARSEASGEPFAFTDDEADMLLLYGIPTHDLRFMEDIVRGLPLS